jgi:transcriptional regulator with XRE-family HTH domain
MATKKPLHIVDAKKRTKAEQIEVDDRKVALRIKQAVETMGDRGLPPLSYPEIAGLCEVSEKNVWNWAREGKISKAKLPTLAAILGVTVEYLLTGVDSMYDMALDKEPDGFSLRAAHGSLRILPVLEAEDFISGLASQDVLSDRLRQWTEDIESRPITSISIIDETDPGIPTFAMQMTSDIFAGIPRGSIMFFSNKIVPRNGDYSIWLTRWATTKGPKIVVVGGYTAYDAIPDTFPVGIPTRELTPLATVHLQADPFKKRLDDIAIAPATIGADGLEHATRRLLGTLVATQRWISPTRTQRQTRLADRMASMTEETRDDLSETVYDL